MPYVDPNKFKKIVEEKKDTSAFQGGSSLSHEGVRSWLRKEDAWKITKKPEGERVGLEKKLFPQRSSGSFVDRKEAQRVYDDLKDYPTKSKEKYGINNEGERYKMLELLKKFLGK